MLLRSDWCYSADRGNRPGRVDSHAKIHAPCSERITTQALLRFAPNSVFTALPATVFGTKTVVYADCASVMRQGKF
jgi:hypothetical protein